MGHTCQYLELGRMRDEVACKEGYGISQHPCCGSTLSSLGRARAICRACVLPECLGGMQEAWAARESWFHSGTDHRAKHTRGPQEAWARSSVTLRQGTAAVTRTDMFPHSHLLGESRARTPRYNLFCSGCWVGGESVNASVMTSGRHLPTHPCGIKFTLRTFT